MEPLTCPGERAGGLSAPEVAQGGLRVLKGHFQRSLLLEGRRADDRGVESADGASPPTK